MKTENDHTFIICAYKESPYLDKCIQSLLNQTVKSNIVMYTSTPNDYIQDIADKYAIDLYSKNGGSIGKDWNNACIVFSKYLGSYKSS